MGRNSSHIYFQSGGWQPTLQLSCRKESTTPIGHLRGHLGKENTSSRTDCGRPLKSATSHLGATHADSIDLDAGAIWSRAPEKGGPSSEEYARKGQWRGKWVLETRSGWARMVRPAVPAPRPPWACSVCASRLTGGNAYLRKARGQLCASVSVPRGPSIREKYRRQWEDSREANRSIWAYPNRLQIRSVLGGVAVLWGMWAVVKAHRLHLSCVWLQRKRWRASCDMRRDRRTPNRLMYETAAVLSVWTNKCLANSRGLNCRKARCTAHSSRQFMCQSSWGPVQSHEVCWPPIRYSRLPRQTWPSTLGPVPRWRQHPMGAALPNLHPQRMLSHPQMLRSISYPRTAS